MVDQSVQDGGGDCLVCEDLSPFFWGFVGGDDQRCLFVQGVDQVVEVHRFVLVQGKDEHVVDDHQVGVDQPPVFLARLL